MAETYIPHINELWQSQDERMWRQALDRYWSFVKPRNMEIERELDTLDIAMVQQFDMQDWYNFLLHKYFRSKYTAPNRYATTTKSLKRYIENDSLPELYQVKQDLFAFDLEDIRQGLKIATRIMGLGTSGASGLLSILFPKYFGTVDQFAVKALRNVNDLTEQENLQRMKPDGLSISDGAILIRIMKVKANANNLLFASDYWSPRKVDMILWTYGRE